MAGGGKFIQNIEIKNFKIFKNLKIKNLNYFNLFIGHNNMGKTTVLESLSFCLGVFPKGFMESYLQEIRHKNITATTDLRVFFHNLDTNQEIDISLDLGTEQRLQYQFCYQPDDVLTPKLRVSMKTPKEKLDREVVFKEVSLTESAQGQHQLGELLLQQIVAKLQREVETKYLDGGSHNKYLEMTKKYEPVVRFIQNNTAVLSDSESQMIKDRKERSKLLEFMQKIDPNIDEIQLEGNNSLDLYYRGVNNPFPLNEMGTGFIKIIKLYLAIQVNGVDMILFDEITDGLSPPSVRILLEQFLPLLKERNIQLFATTHSYDILNILAQNDESRYDQFSVYRLENKNAEGQSDSISAKQISGLKLRRLFPMYEDVRQGR